MRPTLFSTAIAAAALAAAIGTPPAPARRIASRSAKPHHSLLSSPELWATIDICDPRDKRDTIGVRGSMPGDGRTRQQMYMRFIVQYRDARTGRWLSVGSSADTGFVAVGGANAASRESGRSFVLRTTRRGAAYRLRGEVMFQWRRGIHVIHDAVRYTEGGHNSGASGDPRGYSASTCVLS